MDLNSREKGFADGHRPTNYSKWRSTSKPYYVSYQIELIDIIPSKTSKIKLLHESACLNVSNLTFHLPIIDPKY